MESDVTRPVYSTEHLRKFAQELRGLSPHEQRRLHEIVEQEGRQENALKTSEPPQVGSINRAVDIGLPSTLRYQRPGHSIGWAVEQLWEGRMVGRQGWNGPGQRLGLQVPDAHSANTLPYIFIITVQGQRVPWLASQTDLLATDWVLA